MSAPTARELLAKHARTQVRFFGPGRICGWYCVCGESGQAETRSAAIDAHRGHQADAILASPALDALVAERIAALAEGSDVTWALRTPSVWESPDARSVPTLLAAIGQTLAAALAEPTRACGCAPGVCLSAGAAGCYFGAAGEGECATCSGRTVWMDEPCHDCTIRPVPPGTHAAERRSSDG